METLGSFRTQQNKGDKRRENADGGNGRAKVTSLLNFSLQNHDAPPSRID